MPRPLQLERSFFQSEDWAFIHAVGDLPPDMQRLLEYVAGSDVVGPGERVDLTDLARFPNRVVHSYTALTENLGVVVWYSTGSVQIVHAALYDRKIGDACVYDLGRSTSALFPLDSKLRDGIQAFGAQKGGCKYLPPGSSSAVE